MWRAISVVMATLLILAVSRDFLLPLIGDFLVVADALEPADAIVPLAGERSRVFYAAELFKQGYIRWFVITDMWVASSNPVISYITSVKGQAIREGVPTGRILVAPGTPATTYQEVTILRQMAEEHRWRSLIVVTSPFHTRRARLILRDVFRDTEIAIIVHPMPEHWYRPEHWWTTQRGRQTTASEYLKLVLYLVGYHQMWNH